MQHMAGTGFRLPGFEKPLDTPETFVAGALRNFGEASQALGRATDTLVLRLAGPNRGEHPDYQIQTLDGEDAAAFSGATHDFLHDDITVLIEEDQLQDQLFTAEDVKDWLNIINGEGTGGGPVDPGSMASWREGDIGDPRD
jgi:hypothetical protein